MSPRLRKTGCHWTTNARALVVAGVRKSRGPKSDKRDAFALAEQLRIGALETRVYKGRGKFRRLGSVARGYGLVVVDVARVKNRLKSVLRSRGVGYGAGRSVYAKRERERWLDALPEPTRPLAKLLYEEHDALAGAEGEGREGAAGRGAQAPGVALLKTCPGLGPIRTARAAAGGGDAVPVPEPERVLGVLRAGDRDAELVGLGAGPERRVGEDGGAADAGAEPELQPHAEADLQGRGDDGDRPSRGRSRLPSLRAAPGRRHEAEPGEAHAGASDRGDRPGGVAQRRGVRPEETGSDGVERARIGKRGVEQSARDDGPDEGEANRLQGRASIGFLGWAAGSESPGIGYAPLESRTKRWAEAEPQIEGWFPPPSGERRGCDRLPGCDAEPEQRICHPALSKRSGISKNADAGGQDLAPTACRERAS